jgi:hypothetical protein
MENTISRTNVPNRRTLDRVRDSNIELYRIIAMLLIVAHHYVLNSGLTSADGPIFSAVSSPKSIFLMLFGAWGKTGINCFMLITGYFMCKSNITLRKYVKLLAQICFYKIVIYSIFLITGYESFSIISLVKVILPVIYIKQNFTGCFLMFYLCIPFLKIIVHHLTEKQHKYLLLLSGCIYVLFGIIHAVSMNYVSWFCVLFFIASYIRLYPKAIYQNTKLWGILTLLSVFASAASVVLCAILPEKIGMSPMPFFFVTDSNNLLAVTTGVFSFLFFKNLKIGYSKVINAIASATFGVLLIHANSDTMRQWLWKDTLNNVGMYETNLIYIHAICSVLAIFSICVIIDLLRSRLLEKSFMNFYDKHLEGLLITMWSKVERKLHI